MTDRLCPICNNHERKRFEGNFDRFECAACQGVCIDSRLVRAPTTLDNWISLAGAARELRESFGWPATIRFDGTVTCPDEDGREHAIDTFPTTVAEKAAKLLAVLISRTTYFGEQLTITNDDYLLAYASSDKELRSYINHLEGRGLITNVSRTMHDVSLIVAAQALDAHTSGGAVSIAVSKKGGNSMRILFLAANPTMTPPLDLEEELRSLESELRGVTHRQNITFKARHAVRPDDLIRYVREDKPNVIHFSGHGSTTGIVLRDDAGAGMVVEGASLKRFLEGRGVDLVVLNACYSKGQADTILAAVKAVVGTTEAVDDEAARRFAVAFYRSLGNGLPVREAFRDGGDAIALHGLTDVFHCSGDLGLTLVPTTEEVTPSYSDGTKNKTITPTAEEIEILLKVAGSSEGMINYIRHPSGIQLLAGTHHLITKDDPRVFARWQAAFDHLLQLGLLIDNCHDSERYHLSHQGFNAADQIRRQQNKTP